MAILNQKLFIDILDEKRREILPLLKKFKGRFYLAGGTALALQLGHRDSIDFDFFTWNDFNSKLLFEELKELFSAHKVALIQAGNKTLNLTIDENIKLSFFCIKEKLLGPVIDFDFFDIASINDIACMKVVALLRAELKDYVDLFYLFKQIPLEKVMENCKKKYSGFEEMVYLKAIASLEDINQGEILFKKGKKIEIEEIKKDLQKKANNYLRNIVRQKNA